MEKCPLSFFDHEEGPLAWKRALCTKRVVQLCVALVHVSLWESFMWILINSYCIFQKELIVLDCGEFGSCYNFCGISFYIFVLWGRGPHVISTTRAVY